jgi:hypothetical protein
MAGPRVVVLYEDKTAGGLHHLVRSMVEVYRNEAGREPFAYFGSSPMKGNSKLIEECPVTSDCVFSDPSARIT